MNSLVELLHIVRSYIIFIVSVINVMIIIMAINNNTALLCTTTHYLYTMHPIIIVIVILFLFINHWMELKEDNTDISRQNILLQLSFDCVILCLGCCVVLQVKCVVQKRFCLQKY